ncbi:MAG TPA: hypothetical protein VGC18_06585 [Lacisediminihabitans sp.]|uniref:hypothetical protein n=1 Tax=Lacisediminihabitans sp. TaxID=2787631 RepID=UPI002EDB12DE
MPVAGGGLRAGVEQEREGAGGHRADLVLVGDVDLLEERLVEQAAHGVGCLLVHGVAVAGEVEAVGQFGLRFGVVRAGGVEPAGDLCQCGGDAVLFGFELVERDGSGVVGLHELVALDEQVVLLLGQVLGLKCGLGA